MSKKGSKQEFMTELLAGSGFKVLNGTGIKTMKNGHVAKITIDTMGTHEQYEKLVLKIINKKDGQVDATSFKFNEHLVSDPKNPRYKDYKELEVIASAGWTWYIAYPTKDSVKKMINSINEYVEHFDEESSTSAKLTKAGIEVKDWKISKADVEKAVKTLGSIAKRNIKVSLTYSIDLLTDEKSGKIHEYLGKVKAYPRSFSGNGLYEIRFSCKDYSDAKEIEKEIEKILTTK